jgi:hypothetical protein
MPKLSASNDRGGAAVGGGDDSLTRVDISPDDILKMSDSELAKWLEDLRGSRQTMPAKRGPGRLPKPKLPQGEADDDMGELG